MIVWLASFPRSGNTFLRTLIKQCFGISTYSIYNDCADIAKSDKLTCLTGHVGFESDQLDAMRKSDQLFFIKTHESNAILHRNDTCIYIVRDGRDATCSLSTYTQNYHETYFSPQRIIDGEFLFGSWHDHVAQWCTGSSKIWVIYFENLINNPLEIADAIASRYDLSYVGKNIPNFSALQAMDKTFFSSGSLFNYKQRMNKLEHNYFWFRSYAQMMTHRYVDDMPEIFKNDEYVMFLQGIHRETGESSFLQSYCKSINLEKENIQESYNALEFEKNALGQKFNKLFSENVDVLESYESLILEKNTLQRQCDALMSEKSILCNERDELIQVSIAARETYEDLVGEKNDLQERYDELVRKNASIQKTHDTLQESHNKLLNEKKVLQENYVDLVRNNVVTRKLYDSLDSENKLLLERYEGVKNENDIFEKKWEFAFKEQMSIQSQYDFLLETFKNIRHSVDVLHDSIVEFFSCIKNEEVNNFKLIECNTALRVLIAEERFLWKKHPFRRCFVALCQNSKVLPANFSISHPTSDLSVVFAQVAEQCTSILNMFDCNQQSTMGGPVAHRGAPTDECVSPSPQTSAGTARVEEQTHVLLSFADDLSMQCERWLPEVYQENTFPALVQRPDVSQRIHALHVLHDYPFDRICLSVQNLLNLSLWEGESYELEKKYVYFPFMGKNVIVKKCENIKIPFSEFKGNIAFSHYISDVDLSFLQWCINTHTPVLINRTPATQALLGEAYPLYYYSYPDAIATISKREKVLEAHFYLCSLCQTYPVITPETIVDFAYVKKSHYLALKKCYEELFLTRAVKHACVLKYYQDLFVFAYILQNIPKGGRILEIGGGFSRILSYFSDDYECWCIDSYDGTGNSPMQIPDAGYRIVQDNMGAFNSELPDEYFDLVFSISIMEHLPADGSTVLDVYADINRVLKAGAYSLHTMDVVLRAGEVSMGPFATKIADVPGTLLTSPAFLEKIIKDSDLWVMSECEYNIAWKPYCQKNYEEFGQPTAMNILWRKDY